MITAYELGVVWSVMYTIKMPPSILGMNLKLTHNMETIDLQLLV